MAPDVIVVGNTPSALTLRKETTTIPIVFVNLADPGGSGLVASLARPGGNVTGFTAFEFATAAKWLEVLKEIAPGVKRAALIFGRSEFSPTGEKFYYALEPAASKLSVELTGRLDLPQPIARNLERILSLKVIGMCIFVARCYSILLFDPRREHSSIPTAHCRRRRAQRRSRTALLQRRRRLVLDGREHGGRLPVIGWSAAMIRGEPAIGREQSREPRLYSVEPTWGLDHEAVIRFCGQGSEAAGPFSQRHCSHSRIRIAATSDRHRLPRIQAHSGAEPCFCPFSFYTVAYAAGRNSTPSGISPVVTRRHSAISSLRASATIIVVLRAPFGPSVRMRYHRASALSFWNIRKRHANWISPRRTRALPALARPFSRLFKPLSSGDPVSPAYRATALRSRSFRDRISRTSISAVSMPIPMTLDSRRTIACGPVSGARSSRSTRVFSIALICSRTNASRAMSRWSSSMMFAGRPPSMTVP